MGLYLGANELGGGGGSSAVGSYGLKPMAYGANVFTEPSDGSTWFKTGHTSADTASYPDFISAFGSQARYPQAAVASIGGSAANYTSSAYYNSVENKVIIDRWASYVYANNSTMYELDPTDIAGGDWGNTNISGTAYTHATSKHSFEPVGDGIGNSYVLKTTGTNSNTITGSRGQQRTSNWMQQSILQIGKVSGGTRLSGYTFDQNISITGIPNGTSTSSYAQYQVPISFVATENYFYYSFLQRNPGNNNYLTYYYANSVFWNRANSLTVAQGQQPQPSLPSEVYARVRCVKLSKTGAYIEELTRPFTDGSGGGSALLVFTDPLSTGNSFYTLDKNSLQNGRGPTSAGYAGYMIDSADVDFTNTLAVRKHSEDGTVIKEALNLPITSIDQTQRATSIWQQAFCTPDGTPHYFTAASLAGSAAQTTQKEQDSPLTETFNIIKIGDVIGDPSPRYVDMPMSASREQTGMGINTSNVEISAGPARATFSPTQLYIRVA